MGGNTLKTDVLETDNRGNQTGYTVKATKNPTVPAKINQSGQQTGSRGSFRKLMMPGSDDSTIFTGADSQFGNGQLADRFAEALGDSDVATAYMMAFGNAIPNPTNGGRNYDVKDFFSNLNSEQKEMLEMISRRFNRPFVTPTEMDQNFGGSYDALMQHLTDNKSDIFKQLVRQHEAKYPNSGFRYGDDFPADRLAHLRSGSRSGQIFSGRDRPSTFDIRDISDPAVERAMENVNWYSDDDSFYLAPEETDDWNKRLLGVYPHSREVDRWGAMPGRDRYDLGRIPARARPGMMKATMGIDEGMLNDVFGNPLYSAEVTSRMGRNGEDGFNIRDLFRGGNPVQ